MDVFKLDAQHVADYEEQGLNIRAPLQQVVFEILFGANPPDLQLSWSQLRGCAQFILEPITGRVERVSFIFI